jgi:hypothetical protein
MSTTFFNYSDSLISTSSSIWLYFVITVLLTIGMMGGMFYWQKKRRRVDSGVRSGDPENQMNNDVSVE